MGEQLVIQVPGEGKQIDPERLSGVQGLLAAVGLGDRASQHVEMTDPNSGLVYEGSLENVLTMCETKNLASSPKVLVALCCIALRNSDQASG